MLWGFRRLRLGQPAGVKLGVLQELPLVKHRACPLTEARMHMHDSRRQVLRRIQDKANQRRALMSGSSMMTLPCEAWMAASVAYRSGWHGGLYAPYRAVS